MLRSTSARLFSPRIAVGGVRKAGGRAAHRQNAELESNRHRSFYTQLAPSMLQCLMIASITYIGLEVARTYLDGQEQAGEMREKVSNLEAELHRLYDEQQRREQQEQKNGTGSDSSRRRWTFGLF